jgi:DNA polymerase-3 subunit epsilon
VSEWYGVPHERPGDPRDDAETALVLACIVGACYPPVGRLSRPALHREQAGWYAEHLQEIMTRDPGWEGEQTWPLGTVQAMPWQNHNTDQV